MKHVWIVLTRNVFDDYEIFKNMDDAHDYANVQLAQLREEGLETEIPGQVFSKEKLRKDHYMFLNLGDATVICERRLVK